MLSFIVTNNLTRQMCEYYVKIYYTHQKQDNTVPQVQVEQVVHLVHF